MHEKSLKAQLHVHTRQDPMDNIRHSEREAIDFAAAHGYEVMALTCHNVVLFNSDLKKYAEEKNILLIPAIEKSIQKKHVLILNANIKAQNIQTFEDLKKYKEEHPETFIIAAHPYYRFFISLGKKLEKHIELFDGIEYSWFHTKKLNRWNKKAADIAAQHNLPLIATSDNHILKYFDYGYTLINAEKNIPAIFQALKEKKIQTHSTNLKFWQPIWISIIMELRLLIKRFTLK